ncbi:NIPSNAP family protein [Brachybacterium squillarum]|uniref:NIPSNAP family protein n=1 Tax=Brachybacterium squillarum TaxID=661979 RepID=UPI002223CC6F|nr:NIPSNAP family protein [Brachybacterium squillarum]MCW1804146.1 NIPSNAP family protein [Brachybacterium squillarum]
MDPTELNAFEEFAREWIRLGTKHGGTHHGYFLPAEGASDQAEALFSFESLAAYETYRERLGLLRR